MPRKPRSQWTAEDFAKDVAYQAAYYLKNRDGLQAAKKLRRDTIPEVAAANRLAATLYYHTKIRPNQVRARAGMFDGAPGVDDLAPLAHVDVDGDGTRTALYCTKDLALLLKRGPHTLLQWERRGILARPWHTQKGLGLKLLKGNNPRIYTEAEMRVYEASRALLLKPAVSLEKSPFARQVARLLAH